MAVVSARRHSDPEAAVFDATRRLLGIEHAGDAIEITTDLVADLGGWTVPARDAGSDGLPVDVSFGECEPLTPCAPIGSSARTVLMDVLPSFVDDAQRAVELARRVERLARDAAVDSVTGLSNRRVTFRALARLAPGDMVIAVDLLDGGLPLVDSPEVLRQFARILRRECRALDHCGRLAGAEFVVLMHGAGLDAADALLTRVKRSWESERSGPVAFAAGVGAVTERGGPAAFRAADHAIDDARTTGDDAWAVAVEV